MKNEGQSLDEELNEVRDELENMVTFIRGAFLFYSMKDGTLSKNNSGELRVADGCCLIPWTPSALRREWTQPCLSICVPTVRSLLGRAPDGRQRVAQLLHRRRHRAPHPARLHGAGPAGGRRGLEVAAGRRSGVGPCPQAWIP